MPALGFKLKRNNIISKELYNRFLEETHIELDYKTFQKIILESNSIIFDVVANEPPGFKLPEGMGYLVVTKYKSKKKPVDWVNTKKLKKVIHLPNLHSFGYIHHLKWCKFAIARFKFNEIYKYQPCRFLARKIAKNVKEGVEYFQWQNSDFWNTSKLHRLYNRKYKNEQ